jgi:ubiquinol-cytochrome c reductase iron-sulfur subunit
MSRALVRSAAAARLPKTTTAVRAMSSSPALRDAASSTFQSPFKGESKSTKGSGSSNALISYFMVGTLGAISAAGAKSTVQGEFFFPGFPGGIGKGVDG